MPDGAALAAAPPSVWDFVPTALEWQAWPQYCRVQWTQWTGGLDFESKPVFSETIRNDWRSTLGTNTYTGLHHWCASIHFLARSRATSNAAMKTFNLQRAWVDAEFTYVRAELTSPVYPNIAVTVAQIQFEKGDSDAAIDTLGKAIAAQPQRPEAYGMLASIYRKQHKLAEARDVLVKAAAAHDGSSAELQYNLGLINLELGDVDAALTYARAAYALGYPLPGLKNKLLKLGRWTDK
jgi:tetratricopeptide (TPR) repeat protein